MKGSYTNKPTMIGRYTNIKNTGCSLNQNHRTHQYQNDIHNLSKLNIQGAKKLKEIHKPKLLEINKKRKEKETEKRKRKKEKRKKGSQLLRT